MPLHLVNRNVPICCGLIFLLSLVACRQQNDTPAIEQVRPAKIVTVGAANTLETYRYPAIIKAAEETELNFGVSGVLQELLISEGVRVNQGDILAKLDQRDFVSRLNAAKAQYEVAEQEYQRAVRLMEADAIARRDLEMREAQRDSAKANLETASKALQDTELRAPYAGLIAKIPAKRLQNLQPGTTVATLISTQRWQATFNLPARLIALSPTRTSEGIFISLGSDPDSLLPAVYEEATLDADSASQTYAVTLSFAKPDNRVLLPGMNAEAVLTASATEAVAAGGVTGPLTAIMNDGQQEYVWGYDAEQGTVAKRVVKVQPGIGEMLLIEAGLASGEAIVAAGGAYLSEGMKVRPWDLP